MRRLLCFLGLHRPMIVRTCSWGGCMRAELRCSCGKRFESLIAGSVGSVKAAQSPSEFWKSYDDGAIPREESTGDWGRYV